MTNPHDATGSSDAQLVASYLQGDQAAFATIYDRYADQLVDTAAAMLRDRHEAEDLVHDAFVIAARRLDQLQQPERLRSWLYAVLRNEVYRRSKRRTRMRPTDFAGEAVPEMAAPLDPTAAAGQASADEMATFVRAAAAGLAERDQLLLELSARQGLAGDDLADALGVTVQQTHVLLHRMRDRLRRSLGALTVARYGRRDCDELQAMLRNWDGAFGTKIRKRVAKHIDECEVCDETSRRLAVLPMFSAAPALLASPGLRDRVLASVGGTGSVDPDIGYDFDAAHGFPGEVSRGLVGVVRLAALLVALLVAAGVVFVLLSGDETDVDSMSDAAPVTTTVAVAPAASVAPATVPIATPVTTSPPTTAAAATTPATTAPATTAPPSTTTPSTTTPPTTAPPTTPPPTEPPPPPPPAPGRLSLSASTIDFGPTDTTRTLTLQNTGGTALDWTITGDTAPFAFAASGGTLAPGESVAVAVELNLNRRRTPEGDVAATASISSSAEGSADVALVAQVERPPDVRLQSSSTAVSCWGGGAVVVTIFEESGLDTIELSHTGPGEPGTALMIDLGGGRYEGFLNPDAVNGNWTWQVNATDTRGNTGSLSGPFTVTGC